VIVQKWNRPEVVNPAEHLDLNQQGGSAIEVVGEKMRRAIPDIQGRHYCVKQAGSMGFQAIILHRHSVSAAKEINLNQVRSALVMCLTFPEVLHLSL
jgi:hypothetical protein